MAKNCAQRQRTGRARNAPKNDGLLNVVNLLPRPPTPDSDLLPWSSAYSNFKRQMYAKKKKGKKQERNVEKRSKTNTHRTRSGRRSFEDLSRSLSVALTVAARQPPLWPGQDNRAQAAPKTKPKQKQKQHQNPSEPLPFGFIVHAV